MKFCESHWQKLRNAIEARGLTPFIAKDGTVAAAQMAKQVEEQRSGKHTFDPLMQAHWAVAGNVMDYIGATGNNPLYLMTSGPEDPVVGHAGYEGRTWSRCPLCYINLAHEISCTDPKCQLDKQAGYDWMVDRAAEDSLASAREFGLVS